MTSNKDNSYSHLELLSDGSVNSTPAEGKAKGQTRELFEKKIDTKLLVCLTFFVVAASPVGIEPVVEAGGPLFGIIGIIVFPFIYSIPMAIMASEMASIYPKAGGSVQWTQNISHHFGAVNSYLHILYNWFDNALYPVVIVDNLSYFIPQLSERWWRFLAGVLILFLAGLLNIFGIALVGKAAIVFTVLILIPFLIFAGLSCTEFDIKNWGVTPKKFDWVLYVCTLFWDMCGYDRISDTAEEVKNPTKTFPKALFITVILVTLTYLLPTAFGIMIDPDYTHWEDGYFVDLASMIPILNGSQWLSVLITLAGALSQFGLLLAAISCCSRELFEMAEYRHIPGRKYLMKISKRNEPWVAIIVQSIISAPLVIFDFEFVMVIDGVFYGYVLIIEYISYFYSRFSKKGKIERHRRILEAAKKEIELENALLSMQKELQGEESVRCNNEEDKKKSLTNPDSSNTTPTTSQNSDDNVQKGERIVELAIPIDHASEESEGSSKYTKTGFLDSKVDEILIGEGDAKDVKREKSGNSCDSHIEDEEDKIIASAEKLGKSYKDLAKENMFLMPGGVCGVVLISVTPIVLCILVIIGNGFLVNVLVWCFVALLYCCYFYSYNRRKARGGQGAAST